MADEAKDTGQEEPGKESGKKGGLLKWVLLALVVVVLGAGAYLAYDTYLAPEEPAPMTDNASQADAPRISETGEIHTFALEPFVVNLADPLGRRYLKLAMDFEVRSEKDVAELERNLPKIKDTVLLLLSSKTYNDLSGVEDKILLKKQIVERLNKILGKPVILRVYFTEFVVQ